MLQTNVYFILSINTCRLALGMVSYGIQYGMQALSGNFFLNMFFFSVFSIPSGVVGIALANT